MPKVGMEPLRRAALVDATIKEIGAKGSLDVTVSQIARRAGVSSALAHHYFGSKEQMFLATMRHIMARYGEDVRIALAMAETPRQRVEAVIHASFSPGNFDDAVIAAWLQFYVQAQHSDDALRLLNIYRRRMRSNLIHDLRPLLGTGAGRVADGLAAMVDGLYIRQALHGTAPGRDTAQSLLVDYLDTQIAAQKEAR
ncbi:transcriptional regulator BetI [Tropicimonas sp.]|uniref:transcriptional regulator BetI n=1 Tax=Tropicimonas sp. TaxID=2067044 RepID=UPI003A8B759D